jgi:hypothetical protein
MFFSRIKSEQSLRGGQSKPFHSFADAEQLYPPSIRKNKQTV